MLRFDRSDMTNVRLDHNGYLIADARVTRTGVFVYRHPDGSTTRELRHPDEVFKSDSLKTLNQRPVTDNHPAGGRVDSSNTRLLSVGWSVSEARQDGDFVQQGIQITDKAVIDRAMDKDDPVRELSCGYNSEVVREDGSFNGEPYDHRQTNIVYNHIAIVRKGRAGSQVKLQLDSADAYQDGLELDTDRTDVEESEDKIHIPARDSGQFREGTFRTTDVPGTKGIKMVVGKLKNPSKGQSGSAVLQKFIFDKDRWTTEQARAWVTKHKSDSVEETKTMIKIKREPVKTSTYKCDAIEVEVDDDSESALNIALQRHDDAVTHIVSLEEENQTLKGKVDALKEDTKLDGEKLNKMVQERTDAMGAAKHLGMDGYENLSNDALRKAIVEKANDDLKLDDAEPAYIRGRYDMVLEKIAEERKNEKSHADLKKAIRGDGTERKADDDISPREARNAALRDAWRGDQKSA